MNKPKPPPPRVGVIGQGRWGSALVGGLRSIQIDTDVWQRQDQTRLGAVGLKTWLDRRDVLCLAVRDDQLTALVSQLAEWPHSQRVIMHHAGAISLDVLQPLAEQGAVIGKLHPLQTFSSHAAQVPSGTPFAIEGDISTLVIPWITAWHGQYHYLNGDQWATYHLAAVMAANFLPLLIREGAALLAPLCKDRDAALAWLAPLVQRSVDQALNAENPLPFSGPAARNDQHTMQQQIEFLRTTRPELAQLYQQASQCIRQRLQAKPSKIDDETTPAS